MVRLEIHLAEIKEGVGIIRLQLHGFFQVVFGGGKITVLQMNYTQEKGAEELLRINLQLPLEKRAGRRKAFLFPLSKIGQGEIVVDPRIVWVQLDGLLEFTDRFVQIACLAIRPPEQNMKLRGRAH